MKLRSVMTLSVALAIGLSGLIPTVAATPAHATTSPVSQIVDVANWYDDITGANRYRIPALTQTNSGDLLAIYDMRPAMNDLPSNIGVVMRRSTDGGQTWGPVQTIRYETDKAGFGDPSVLVDRTTGRIFVFYAGTVNQGFAGATASNDDTDPNTMQVDYSYSDDNGVTWKHERITSETKDTSWKGIFAASGEGIQLRQGEHAGRLIQQYVVNADGNKNVSLYSDDHGATWQFGTPYGGAGGDENKVVELSDGTLTMSMRSAPYRKLATSTDQGVTWTDARVDYQQIDPASNGTIIRVYPDAAAGSAESKILMLLNAEDSDIRRNVTAKVSYDDGKTWPGRVTIDAGESEYVTGTPIYTGGYSASGKQASGKVAVLYERDGYSKISFTTVDVNAMNIAPAPIKATNGDAEVTPDARFTIESGATADLTLTVTNQGSTQLAAGKISIKGRSETDQWEDASEVSVPAIEAGGSQTVKLKLQAPNNIAGKRTLTATYSSGELSSQQFVYVNVTRAANASDNPKLIVESYLDAVYTDNTAGLVGDTVVPWVRVTNVGNVAISNIQTQVTDANIPGIGGCKWSSGFGPGEAQLCKGNQSGALLKYSLTQSDIDAGKSNPVFTATGVADGKTITSAAANNLVIDTKPETINASGVADSATKVYLPTGDFQSSSYVRLNDVTKDSWLLPAGQPLGLDMAKANRTSAQLVVNPASAGTLSAEVSGGEGIDWEITYPSEIPNSTKGALTGGNTTDPLQTATPKVTAGKNQAIWFVANVTKDAPTGIVKQNVTIKLDDQVIASYPISVNVRDVTLASSEDRPFTLDLWWHPDAIADFYGDSVWSDEHFEHMKPYLQELADAGQDVVNIVVTEDPWILTDTGKPQTASHYHSAVEWKYDGTNFTFDFTNFDKVIAAHDEVGIDGPIHLFSPLQFRHNESITYTQDGETKTVSAPLGGELYNKAWGQFLRALEEHMKANGTFDRAALAFDEQDTQYLDKLDAMLASEAPDWSEKIAMAVDKVAGADAASYIALNYQILDKITDETIAERHQEGETTLFYTWAEPALPNVLTSTPPMSARTLGWIVEKRDLDGFLRWTFNSWPKDVYANPTFMYTQGDEYLVYPGGTSGDAKAISSMRWETFQDGLDDAEIVREAKATIDVDQVALKLALDSVTNTAVDSPQAWAAMVAARSKALDLIGEQENSTAQLAANAEKTDVVPGSPVKVDVTLTAPAAASMSNVTVNANAPQGWQITPAEQNVEKIKAGASATLSYWVANNYGEGDPGEITFTTTFNDAALTASVTLNPVNNICLPAKITSITASSQEAGEADHDNKIENTIDGDPATIWHSKWDSPEAGIYVIMQTDAKEGEQLCSVNYLQRQETTGSGNGKLSAYSLFTSVDGQTWGTATTGNANDDSNWQEFALPEGSTGPWVKLVYDQSRGDFASAAEFSVTKRVKVDTQVTFVDEENPDGTRIQSFTIPDNAIQYVVNGKPADPGTHEAKPGLKVSITMNGLAEYGYELASDVAADWEYTFKGEPEASTIDSNSGSSQDGESGIIGKLKKAKNLPATGAIGSSALVIGVAVLISVAGMKPRRRS